MHSGIRVLGQIRHVWLRMGSTHHLADEGDPFASANRQHRSSELFVSAKKSPELSVPSANQLPETKQSENSLMETGIHSSWCQFSEDCVLCISLAYHQITLQNCILALSHWHILKDLGQSNCKNWCWYLLSDTVKTSGPGSHNSLFENSLEEGISGLCTRNT